jgi:DNA-binding SARP family transcriptional activator
MTDSVRVNLLGPFEVRRNDRTLGIASALQRTLVARLALDAGRVLPVDRLVDGPWGAEPPADARGALQHHVSRLRKVIGPALVTRGPGYLLDLAPHDVDALAFAELAGAGRAALRRGAVTEAAATLRSALVLWRDPPLEEFLDRDWARPPPPACTRSSWAPWRTASTPTWRRAGTPTWWRRSARSSRGTSSGSVCGDS